MRFNPKARLDTSRVRDVGAGGRSGGGGPVRLPMPGGMKAGGGISGLIIIILFIVLSSCLGGGGGMSLPGGTDLDTSQMGGAETDRYDACRSGEDANSSADCRRVAVENSLRDFWEGQWEAQFERGFSPASVQTFTGATSTGCGRASSQVGPFYCPTDQGIYLDTTFFADVLERQLGGPSGAFVEPYVLAHEYGHHIQNLMNTMGRVKTQQGPRSDAVRLELQADCYAGMWTRAADGTDGAGGEPLIVDISEQDYREAIAAAGAVGDDRIQEKTQGQVTEESWTHGSAASRQRWFDTGYQTGDLRACDTWAVGTP